MTCVEDQAFLLRLVQGEAMCLLRDVCVYMNAHVFDESPVCLLESLNMNFERCPRLSRLQVKLTFVLRVMAFLSYRERFLSVTE